MNDAMRVGVAWRSIDSAPKDGTAVLAHFGGDRHGVIHWTGWGGGTWRCHFTGHNISSEPTHWMPLPAPPEPATVPPDGREP